MDETTAYLPGLSPVENKELCARFDGGRLSSDGGVLMLRGIEQRLGLAARLAGCLYYGDSNRNYSSFFRGPRFLAAQGLAETRFKRFHEGIAADGSVDDFTFSKFRLLSP